MVIAIKELVFETAEQMGLIPYPREPLIFSYSIDARFTYVIFIAYKWPFGAADFLYVDISFILRRGLVW